MGFIFLGSPQEDNYMESDESEASYHGVMGY